MKKLTILLALACTAAYAQDKPSDFQKKTLQEILQPFFSHMLHDNNMGQFAAEAVILIGGQGVLFRNRFGRAFEINCIRHRFQPCFPAHLIQSAF